MCSPTDREFWFRALGGDVLLCSWARHFTLTVPLSTHVYKWVPANLMLGCLPYNGLAFHRGGRGVEILLATSSSWLLHPGVLATWLICKLSLYLTEWVTPARAKMKPDLDKDVYLRTSYLCGHDVANHIRWISSSADYCLTHFATGNSRCRNCSRNQQAQYKWSCLSHPRTTGLTGRDLRGSGSSWVMKILEEWRQLKSNPDSILLKPENTKFNFQ